MMVIKAMRKSVEHKDRPAAYWVFDPEAAVRFSVARMDLDVRTGRYKSRFQPAARNGATDWMMKELIPVTDTIISLSDYWHDGATISIEDPKEGERIYNRILKLLEVHLDAVNTDPFYEPPEGDVLMELAELAIGIRHLTTRGIMGDPDVIRNRLSCGLAGRAKFSTKSYDKRKNGGPEVVEVTEEVPEEPTQIEKVFTKYDQVMTLLENRNAAWR